MRCDYCDIEMLETKATKEEPYAYELSGLKNVFLIGISLHRCPQCRFESPIIPRVANLHQKIADILIQKPSPLRGDEVRFLRQLAGFSARQFAGLIEVDPTHLSRVENGHTKHLGGAADRLVRLYMRMAKEDQSSRKLLAQLANEAENPAPSRNKAGKASQAMKKARLRIEAEQRKNQWQASAEAA